MKKMRFLLNLLKEENKRSIFLIFCEKKGYFLRGGVDNYKVVFTPLFIDLVQRKRFLQ